MQTKVSEREPRTDRQERPLPPEAAQIDWDGLEPVDADVRPPADGLTCRLTVRFDGRTIDALAREARRMGIGPGTLARIWTVERLRALGALPGD